ncbi:MAG: DUF3775 domain-containing protein [Gemmataceae bacterium]|nr:DUF3775 domain-containing protein [Gemmataceae bacterium]
MKLSETAQKVIALAEAIRKYWETELPKRHRDYPLIRAGEDSGPPPPEEKKLKNLLEKLPNNDIYKLALIMFLGRGDFGTDELPAKYKALTETFGKPEQAASRLIAKGALADYLNDGLVQLKKNAIDIDDLAHTLVNSTR